jgi:hypothetical protein
VAALIFVPAASFKFWQGWAFVSTLVVFNAILVGYFYRRDPRLLERSLQDKEQSKHKDNSKCLGCHSGFVRWCLGWTLLRLVSELSGRRRADAADVLLFNSVASAIVQVETGQKLVTDGPYRLARHPMYTGFGLMILATPLALGSYSAFVLALLIIPVLVFRSLWRLRALGQARGPNILRTQPKNTVSVEPCS